VGALTKADIAQDITDQLGFNMRESKQMVDLVFEEISRTLEDGEEVRLAGLGKLSRRDKGERPGRNPRTGEEVSVSARTVVLFTAGTTLTESIRQIED